MSTNNKPFRIAYQFLIFILIHFIYSGCGTNKSLENEYNAYLFSYFTGNAPGEEAIRFAISEDGYNYRALNNNQAVLDNAKISSTGGVRVILSTQILHNRLVMNCSMVDKNFKMTNRSIQ